MPSLEWLKHAFAVAPADGSSVSGEQGRVVDRIAHEVVRRGLTTPAVLYLEMSRPLGFLAAQAIHFFTPLLSVFTDSQDHRHFAEFLERPNAIDHLIQRIETFANDASQHRSRDTEGPPSETL